MKIKEYEDKDKFVNKYDTEIKKFTNLKTKKQK